MQTQWVSGNCCCSTDSLRLQLTMSSPRSVFSHITTILACTLLLATTSSSAGPVESAQPTIDDALIYEIVSHVRPVVLITQLTNNHILVIIGSTGHRTELALNDAHVFEQPLENLGSDCIHLKPSTPFLIRWPTVTGRYQAMFAVPDSTGDNIVLKDRDQMWAYALHLSTGTLEALPKLNGDLAINALEWSWSFSSTDPVHYLLVAKKSPSWWTLLDFDSSTLNQSKSINQDKVYYICDSGLSSSGQRIWVSSARCKVPVKWNITAGFINATSVVLVNKTNSVLIFDRSVLTSGQPVDVIKISAENFWVKWMPPLEPSNQTRASSTEKPASTKWTESTTAKWPVGLVLAIAVPNLLLVLGLAGLGIYCFCKPKQPGDKSVVAKPPKVADGPRNQQDYKSTARTSRKGGTKEKPCPSAANLKPKAARSSTGAKKATSSSSSHLPGKSDSKVDKTLKSSSVGKSATAVSKASKNANASTNKCLLADQTAPSTKARVH